MAASRILDIMTDSFFDGITGAALFGKLRRPGAPTVLVDERPPKDMRARLAYEEFLLRGPGMAATIWIQKQQRQIAEKIQQSARDTRLDEMLRSAPEIVGESDRRLFWLYYLFGFSAEELAAMPGPKRTPKQVERALRRVTDWLRKEMNSRESSPDMQSPLAFEMATPRKTGTQK